MFLKLGNTIYIILVFSVGVVTVFSLCGAVLLPEMNTRVVVQKDSLDLRRVKCKDKLYLGNQKGKQSCN